MELSTTSYTRWCRPRDEVEPTYMPGRLRTASRPFRTWIFPASYCCVMRRWVRAKNGAEQTAKRLTQQPVKTNGSGRPKSTSTAIPNFLAAKILGRDLPADSRQGSGGVCPVQRLQQV